MAMPPLTAETPNLSDKYLVMASTLQELLPLPFFVYMAADLRTFWEYEEGEWVYVKYATRTYNSHVAEEKNISTYVKLLLATSF